MATIDRPAALSDTTPPRHVHGSWANAQEAAAELAGELTHAGLHGACVGLRAGRNVVGRPVVRLGSMDPDVARRLADLLRIASTRTLYIVRTDPADAPVPGGRRDRRERAGRGR